jgi:hypothetical protein
MAEPTAPVSPPSNARLILRPGKPALYEVDGQQTEVISLDTSTYQSQGYVTATLAPGSSTAPAPAPATAPAGALAPPALSPSPSVATAAPTAVPTPSQPAAAATPASSAASAPAATAPNLSANPTLAAQTDAAERLRKALTIFHTGYGDPTNIWAKHTEYVLRFIPDWNPDIYNNPSTSVQLPFVSRITMQAPNAIARTRGLNGAVYQEHSGFVQRTFTIEGRSGPAWSVEGVNEQLLITRFTALRNLIEDYGRISTENKNALVRYKNSMLLLLCFFEGEKHLCDIVNFSYRRSSDTSTFSFEYTITLVTNGTRAFSKWSDATLKEGTAQGVWEKSMGKAFAALAKRVTEGEVNEFYGELAANMFTAYYLPSRVAQDSIKFGVPRTIQTMSCSALNEFRLGASIAGASLDNGILTRGISERALSKAKATVAMSSYVLDMVHKYKGGNNIACPVPPWSDLYYGLLSNGIKAAALVRFLGTGFTDTDNYQGDYQPPIRAAFAFGPAQPEPPFTATNYFLLQNGADAYSVAAAVFADRNQYWRIIELNNLRDAYTRGDGTPLVPGSTILVPTPQSPAAKNNDVLGTDLLLVDGDLKLVGNNDIMRVSGYACYSQNISHRMQTSRGSNKVFPLYGLSGDLLTSSGSTVPALVYSEVFEQLSRDHRTESVLGIKLSEQGDKVHVDARVKPLDTAPYSISFNYNLDAEVSA